MARFAFVEEWMSLRASHVLPYLANTHEIHYIASGTDIPQADFVSVKLFNFPRYQQQNSIRIARAVRKLYKQGKIDFVIDYSYMTWLLSDIPVISIVGGLYYNDFINKWNSSSLFGYLRLIIGYFHYSFPERICINKARVIITDNHVNAQIMHEKFNQNLEKINIIPNGVDSQFFDLYKKKDFSIPALLFVGTLHPRKGILPVLQRFSECKDLDVLFTVCGDGPDRAAIEVLASRDSRISFRGRVSRKELLQIEKKSTVFVFPSLSEGCPNALLEAMASGHACITYDVETVRPVICNSGLEARANQVAEVIDYISMLLRDNVLLREKALDAHERSMNYSWAKCASQIGEVISQFSQEEENATNC